jgi:hypothetical protein
MDMSKNIWVDLSVSVIDEDLLTVPQRDTTSYLCKICLDETKKFYELHVVFDTANPYVKKNFLLDHGLRVSLFKHASVGDKLISQRIASMCDVPPSVMTTHIDKNIITSTGSWMVNSQRVGTIDVTYSVITNKHSRILSGIYMKFNSEEITDVFENINAAVIQMRN